MKWTASKVLSALKFKMSSDTQTDIIWRFISTCTFKQISQWLALTLNKTILKVGDHTELMNPTHSYISYFSKALWCVRTWRFGKVSMYMLTGDNHSFFEVRVYIYIYFLFFIQCKDISKLLLRLSKLTYYNFFLFSPAFITCVISCIC